MTCLLYRLACSCVRRHFSSCTNGQCRRLQRPGFIPPTPAMTANVNVADGIENRQERGVDYLKPRPPSSIWWVVRAGP